MLLNTDVHARNRKLPHTKAHRRHRRGAFCLKLTAWWLTNSVAIFTDAMESIVNVVNDVYWPYSLHLSAQPKDHNHPYGHGKVEFVSAAIEGTLISVAGLLSFTRPSTTCNTRTNWAVGHGHFAHCRNGGGQFRAGANGRPARHQKQFACTVATGEHLKSDFWSTAGLIVGLILIRLTNLAWLDSAVALVFAGFIIFTRYKILRSSLAGIMDEADKELLSRFAEVLEQNRTENWVDLHNLRVIKYGSTLHLDCHLTVPWYLNVHEAHREVDRLDAFAKSNFGESVELFVHTDGCLDFSCRICEKTDCPARKLPFKKRCAGTSRTSCVTTNTALRTEKMRQISLTRLLWCDGLAALVAGLWILSLRQFLSGLLGFPLWLSVLQGCTNLCYATYSLSLARRKHRPRWMLWMLCVATWPTRCSRSCCCAHFSRFCTAWGVAFFVAEILIVGGLGVLEALIFRRLSL